MAQIPKDVGISNNGNNEIIYYLLERVKHYREMIQRTYMTQIKYRECHILQPNETNSAIEELNEINRDITIIEGKCNTGIDDIDTVLNMTQLLNNRFSLFFKQHGTQFIDDLLYVVFGREYITNQVENNCELMEKYFFINTYVRPVHYKMIPWSIQTRGNTKPTTSKSIILEDIYIAESSDTFDIYDVRKTNIKSIQYRIHGVKIVFQNVSTKQTLIVMGLMDNIPIEYVNIDYLTNRHAAVLKEKPERDEFNDERFDTFCRSLSLKDIVVFSPSEHYETYIGYITNVKNIQKQAITKITRDFINLSPLEQRTLLIQLLIHSDNFEIQFIAYLLYDILTVDSKESKLGVEHDGLYESLPWIIKTKFRGAMKHTIEYTSKLLNYDINQSLPLEQRICLMKTTENVKEKALSKVKELKSKTEDTGSKARQYIDGLLKIPFGIYRNEPILNVLGENIENYNHIVLNIKDVDFKKQLIEPSKITNAGILQQYHILMKYFQEEDEKGLHKHISQIIDVVKKMKRVELNELCNMIQTIEGNLFHIGSEVHCVKSDIVGAVQYFLYNCKSFEIISKIYQFVLVKNDVLVTSSVPDKLVCINHNYKKIHSYMDQVGHVLDNAVHGHKNAKRQIERIIGQWINGETSGYCFGFEGPPGVGKTSLAKKGLSRCLIDDENMSRPFSFIAIGGSSNGATLDGHNYTYVGSMWGKIVDILMETKCMNPIIFIDEVDKVSRTEAGREIIGILTHLIDTTQNDCFQDKYFSGVDIDLSRALFIFSYNDVELMDRILLDRIHRIRFEPLTLDEKLVICEKYMLPEIYEKMGQTNNIRISSDILRFIIDTYTCEAGVRKLREIIFEIVAEINLKLLKEDMEFIELPIDITEEMVTNDFLKKRHMVKLKKIHPSPRVGLINGLWANALGKGGITQIECEFILATNMLELKLTGMQGDVMKESMNVAKTLAWKLTPSEKQKELVTRFEDSKTQGIHIHCPEGATPKDGPSAGTAITTLIYSMLNHRKIRNDLAITGEMNLQGKVTEIGGLDLKILGGIAAGVKTFLFPADNSRDFDEFMEKHGTKEEVERCTFHQIETIEEALKYALDDDE